MPIGLRALHSSASPTDMELIKRKHWPCRIDGFADGVVKRIHPSIHNSHGGADLAVICLDYYDGCNGGKYRLFRCTAYES